MAKKSELPDLFGRATIVLGGHEGLRETVQVLRSISKAVREKRPVSLEDVTARIAAFAERVHFHFAAEESPEYFGTLSTQSPSLEEAILRLRSEHRRMSELLSSLREFDDLSARAAEFGDELDRFLDLLAEHERREHELLSAFFASDGA